VDLFFWFAGGLWVVASFAFGRSKLASMNRVRLLFLPLFGPAGASVPAGAVEATEWILFLLSSERVESLGMDLVCSPVCFFFRVSSSAASDGFSFRSLMSAPVMADWMLGQGLDDGGRYTTTSTSHAASKSWRPRSSFWLGSSPGRNGSSPTPAAQQDSWMLGWAEGLGIFVSNSTFVRVLCVSFSPWRLCFAVCVVFSSFFKGLLVKDMG